MGSACEYIVALGMTGLVCAPGESHFGFAGLDHGHAYGTDSIVLRTLLEIISIAGADASNSVDGA